MSTAQITAMNKHAMKNVLVALRFIGILAEVRFKINVCGEFMSIVDLVFFFNTG